MIQYIKTIEEFDAIIAKAKGENKAVLVDFTASWCGPCKAIAPVLDKHAENAQAENADPKILFYKVDVDDASEIAQRAKIQSMPTFRVYNSKAEGDYVELKGAIPQKLAELIADAIRV